MIRVSTSAWLCALLLLGKNASSLPSDSRQARNAAYHSQDPTSGAYQYGYTGPHHAKSESSVNGVTRGGYSYMDANGLLQTVSYTADAENGFRVQASNAPNGLQQVQDTAEVALAKRRHLEQVRRASWQQQPQPQEQQARQFRRRSPFSLTAEEARGVPQPPIPSGFSTSSTSSHLLFPIAGPAIIALPGPVPVLHSHMSHSQDSLGQYEYSYTGDTSAKTESRSLDGTTRGAYSYIDPNGLLQQVHYIADHNGFRVLGTNLPHA